MSGAVIAAASTQGEFGRAAHPHTVGTPSAPRKRPPPVSVRFSDAQLETLKRQANGEALGTYIKSKLFDGSSAISKRSIVRDYELLAQVLSTLGQSEVFANLDKIAQVIEHGAVELPDEQQESIALACLLIFELRDDVITALGLRPR